MMLVKLLRGPYICAASRIAWCVAKNKKQAFPEELSHMKSQSRLAPLWALVARVQTLIGLGDHRKPPLEFPRRAPTRKIARGPVPRRRAPTKQHSSAPFPTRHLWCIAAVVLATLTLTGVLNAAPPSITAPQGSVASASIADSLKGFFTRLWSPGAADAEKLGTAYMYDEQGNLLSETGTGGANSTGSTQYIYLPTANGPMPVAAVINGQLHAVHSDHLNTPRQLTNANGQVVWQLAYSAFGDEKPTLAKYRFANLDITPNPGTTGISEVVFNLRYPGQYFDKESGLHYNYFRTYCPSCGRYTQADPIGWAGGANPFTYVSGNSLTKKDPFGLAEYLGIPIIESHLRWLAKIQGADFDTDPFDAPNREMLRRLKRGEESGWDIAFYRHEMAEAGLCNSVRTLPLEKALEAQKQSHERVLREQQNREKDLYHPDVVRRHRDVFGKNW